MILCNLKERSLKLSIKNCG